MNTHRTASATLEAEEVKEGSHSDEIHTEVGKRDYIVRQSLLSMNLPLLTYERTQIG